MTTYLLKTRSGRSVMAFNSVSDARKGKIQQEQRLGIPLQLVCQVVYERRVA